MNRSVVVKVFGTAAIERRVKHNKNIQSVDYIALVIRAAWKN
jgi:hypothetical protein